MIELNPPLQSVSEITQVRLGIIRDISESYQPNESVLRELGHKTLVPIVGPCAVGKSYVIDALVSHHQDWAKVRSFSTRDPRPDDTPDTMVCLPWDERHVKRICNTIEAGEAVQYVFHPKTDDIYGSTVESYPGTYNLLPALSNSVAALERLPFHAVRVAGLVTSPDAWTEWFEQRSFVSSADRRARIAEAALSLEWLLDNTQTAIVTNLPSQPDYAAHAIRAFAAASVDSAPPRDEALAIELYQHVTSL